MILPFLFVLLSLVSSQTPFSATVLGGAMTINWSIDPTLTFLQCTVTSKSMTWVGIGWHKANATGMEYMDMYDVDFATADFSSGSPMIIDRKTNPSSSDGKTTPVLDTSIGGTNDVFMTSGSQVGSLTSFTFYKNLTTADVVADNPILDLTTYHVIIAHGTDQYFGYHKTFRGHWLINWFSGMNGPCQNC